MPVLQTAEEFLSVVRRSGLFSEEENAALPWRYELREKTTAIEVAQALLDKRVLTKYQARRLLQGGGRGLRLGDYRVLDLLGVGGMGWVYLAEEVGTGWKVAVKVLADKHRRDWGMLSRFQLEAQAGLKLTHPNIIRTQGIFTTEDIYGQIHYIVTEFIQGITLFELIALKRTIPWRQACDIIRQAALGLQHSHKFGMIHRDVKPENILVRSDGTAKVLDFGLAMINKSDEEFAMAMIHGQNCLGTADYVAPEQSIDSFTVDARADVYSLGCAFYFALTGQVPFPYEGKSKAESTSMKLKCHRQVKPKPIATMRPDAPERVGAIVEKMMAKKPDNRIASAALVAQLLEPWARREPVEFDFNYVLKYRQKEADRRRTVLQAGRTAASRGNSSASVGQGSSAANQQSPSSATSAKAVKTRPGSSGLGSSAVMLNTQGVLGVDSSMRDSKLTPQNQVSQNGARPASRNDASAKGAAPLGQSSPTPLAPFEESRPGSDLLPEGLSSMPTGSLASAQSETSRSGGLGSALDSGLNSGIGSGIGSGIDSGFGSELSGGGLSSAQSGMKTRASLAGSPQSSSPVPAIAEDTSIGDNTGVEKRQRGS